MDEERDYVDPHNIGGGESDNGFLLKSDGTNAAVIELENPTLEKSHAEGKNATIIAVGFEDRDSDTEAKDADSTTEKMKTEMKELDVFRIVEDRRKIDEIVASDIVQSSKKSLQVMEKLNVENRQDFLHNISHSLNKHKHSMESAYETISESRLRKATKILRTTVIRSHGATTFWQNTFMYLEDDKRKSKSCLTKEQTLNAVFWVKLLSLGIFLLCTFMERPIWCYTDEEYDSAAYYEDKYWDASRVFFDPATVAAFDLCATALLAMTCCTKIYEVRLERPDLALFVLLSFLAVMRVTSVAASNDASRVSSECASYTRIVIILVSIKPLRTGLKMSLVTLPAVFDVLGLYIIFCVICAILIHSFLIPDEEYVDVSANNRRIEDRYGNIWVSIRSIFYFTTALTVPSDLTNAINENLAFSIPFAIFSFFGTFTFLPLLLASVLRKAKDNYNQERRIQRKALEFLGYVRAFVTLDEDSKGYLGYAACDQLVHSLFEAGLLRQKLHTTLFRQIIEHVDGDLSGTISLKEFTHLCQLLEIVRPINHERMKRLASQVQNNDSMSFLVRLAKRIDKFRGVTNRNDGFCDVVDGSDSTDNDFKSVSTQCLAFVHRMRSIFAAMVPSSVMTALRNIFWEPAHDIDPAYQWYKMENKLSDIAPGLLKTLGWGVMEGGENFSGARDLYFIHPELWREMTAPGAFDVSGLGQKRQKMRRWTQRWTRMFTKRQKSPKHIRKKRSSSRRSIQTTSSNLRRTKLLIEFMHTKMLPYDSLESYTKEIRKKRERIEDITGIPLTDDFTNTVLMNGLLPSIGSGIFIMDEQDHAENSQREHSDASSSKTSSHATSTMSYEEHVEWILNVEVPNRHILRKGDYVIIKKKSSVNHDKKATVVDIDNVNGCIRVQCCLSQNMFTYQSHQLIRAQPTTNPLRVLDWMEQSRNSEDADRQRNMPSKENARRAAEAAMLGALFAKVVTSKTQRVCRSLEDAVAYQIFDSRQDSSELKWLISSVSLLFQFILHLGSAITIATVMKDETIGMTALHDTGFFIATFAIMLLKLLSGSNRFLRDMIVVLLSFLFEMIPAMAVNDSRSADSSVVLWCLGVVVLVRCSASLRVVTRTYHFYVVEKLLTAAIPNMALILLHTFLWLLIFARIGMASFGGLIWDNNAVEAAGGNATWCAGQVCSSADTVYNFNTVENSIVLLQVSCIKPFYFADLLYELADLGVYVYFVMFWLVVPLSNLLLLKAVIFQNYFKQKEKYETIMAWLAEKEKRFVQMTFPDVLLVKKKTNESCVYNAMLGFFYFFFGSPVSQEVEWIMTKLEVNAQNKLHRTLSGLQRKRTSSSSHLRRRTSSNAGDSEDL